MNRRVTALLLALGVAAAAAACSTREPQRQYSQKLVIIGFDGMDPDLLKQWMEAGRLPTFKKLAERGGMYPLSTTHSPESPTAWASFATGVNAGKHNIYDFLVRDTTTYFPDLGMVRREPPKFLFDYIPVKKPKIFSTRGGTSFWVTAGEAGVRASILTVPVTFPPEDVPNGEMLSGLPLPDIRGTMGTFSYYATDLSRYEEVYTEMGGILRRLVVDNDVAKTELVGPPNPVVRQKILALRAKGAAQTDADRKSIAALELQEDVRVPFTVKWNRAAKTATVRAAMTQGRKVDSMVLVRVVPAEAGTQGRALRAPSGALDPRLRGDDGMQKIRAPAPEGGAAWKTDPARGSRARPSNLKDPAR